MIQFFEEDEEFLIRRYGDETLLSLPFEGSQQRLAYAEIAGLAPSQAAQIVVRKRPDPWRLDEDLAAFSASSFEAWRAARPKLQLYEGNNARCSDLRPGAPPVLEIQPVRYEDYIRTNLLLDHGTGGHPTLRDRIHPGGQLEPLGASRLGNNIGVNILLINSAGEIPLQVRSDQLAVRPGQICSSASGALQYDDVPRDGTGLADCSLLREVHEELGAVWAAEFAPRPKILGLARELARGGQLEIFLAVECEFSREQLEAARSAAGSDEVSSLSFLSIPKHGGHYRLDDLHQMLRRLEQSFPGRIAAPLRANLCLWMRYLVSQGHAD